MKKIMVAMMAVLILTTGCSKKEESNQDTNVKTNESIGKKEVKGKVMKKGESEKSKKIKRGKIMLT